MEKKHILVVSQYFYPETFRINDMCLDWVKRGYKVSVVTGIPNYPMGKTFDGYGLFKKRHEMWNGIEIFRIPLIPRGRNKIGMVANYLSFMISGKLSGRFKKISADIVFSFEVSPMTQVLTGVAFSKHLKVPHLLYVQDLWPENVITVTGINNHFIIGSIDKMVDKIYKNTDHIFATSPSFVDAICDRKVSVPREKVHYWPQYAEDFYKPMDRKRVALDAERLGIPNDDSFKIIFTGNIGTAQGLDVLPKAAEHLKDENIKFVIVGDGRYLEEFVSDIEKRDVIDKFVMIPRQPADMIPMLLSACDIAFVSFANNDLWKKTIPAKLQSYMSCGMPVIASAGGETERIIEESGCGICCSVGDEKALAEGIRNIMKSDLLNMRQGSLEYCKKNFDKKTLMDEMECYLK